MTASLLTGIRVLDLSTSRAELAGRLLADLGAEVLKIEMPAVGSQARHIPPFDEKALNHLSLYWAAVGLGKHSAMLSLDNDDDWQSFRDLCDTADILIESFDPGYMARIGLDYDSLAATNPRLIYISVTPYGQTGPKAQWPASELTIEAAAGRIALQGDRDRAPLPIGYPQAAFHAGGQAAADAVIALNERELSGRGQYLDTSMQTSMAWTMMNSFGFPPLTGADPVGLGDDRGPIPLLPPPNIALVPCADGFILANNTLNEQVARILPAAVLPELARRGAARPNLEAIDWAAWLAAAQEGKGDKEVLSDAYDAIRAFCIAMTKQEIITWASANDMRFAPVHTTKELLDFPQFKARDYWQRVGDYLHPGPAAKLSRTPITFDRPAPKLGADQHLIAEWLKDANTQRRGRSRTAPTLLPSEAPVPRLGEAFKGLKVADFSWVAIGPLTGKALADHGATVVRIESATRIDYIRTLAPFKDNIPGPNRGHYANNLNTSKLGLALNLRTEAGRDLARKMAAWADVVIENFTPGTMQRLGLDYETLQQGHEDLIMISTCLLGQNGPWANFAGYGPHGASLAGIFNITGWPERPPFGPAGPYTDVVAPRYSISILGAALYERRRSGLGQHIDLSQVEAAIHFIEPLVLDETVNGRIAGPAGQNSLTACPHGVYQTAGTERYIAISASGSQWLNLLDVAPLSQFADPRFEALEARLAVRDDIEAAMRTWIATQDGRDLEQRLIQAGVPAAVAQRPSEVLADPQMIARDYFVTLNHSEIGPTPFDGLPTRFSAKQVQLHKAAPCLGEDTEYVVREILGLSDEQIIEHAANGVFQ